MIRILGNFFIASCFLGLSVSVKAATIIDTGTASSNLGAISLGNNNIFQQSVGAGFLLTNSYEITDISSFFWTKSAGTLTVSLYGDSDGLPSGKLYSQEFSITSAPFTKSWSGVSGLSWLASAGNYWLTYEVLNGQTFDGALEFPAQYPLEMVVKNDTLTDWSHHGANSFSLVVSGNSISPVPIPASAYLFGSALLGFMGLRRKAKNSIV